MWARDDLADKLRRVRTSSRLTATLKTLNSELRRKMRVGINNSRYILSVGTVGEQLLDSKRARSGWIIVRGWNSNATSVRAIFIDKAENGDAVPNGQKRKARRLSVEYALKWGC